MDKLNRSYELRVQRVDGGYQVFTLPYTIEFSVARNNLSSPNTATISIYNLSPETRNALRKDIVEFDVSRSVTLSIGYGENLSTVFSGTLDQCWSARQGTNFITHLSARDNGFVYSNTDISISWSANQTKVAVVDDILKQLSVVGITKGIIGDIRGSFLRAGTYKGKAQDFLAGLTDGHVYIDSNRLFVLYDGEAFEGPYAQIDYTTGLIGTPVLENNFLRCELILEPRVLVGQSIKLDTVTGSNPNSLDPEAGGQQWATIRNFNGTYKVTGISHSGTISATTAGSATTGLELAGTAITTTYRGLL